jgi:hypothetical protein
MPNLDNFAVPKKVVPERIKPQAKSPTFIFVGALIGAALLYVAYLLFSWPWVLGLTAILIWEAWTFFNNYKNDTISEILWVLGQRPLVPFIFGAASVAAIQFLVPITREGVYKRD